MRRLLILGMLLGTVVASARFGHTGPRDDQWKLVDDAVKNGLPKTAVEKLAPILAQAKQDKAWPEAIKAVGLQIALEGNVQGNKPEEKITRMQAAIAASPAEMQPMMHAVLAHWYWHYFQQNRWRILQRTQTSQTPGDDLTTWPLARVMQEIDAQFDRSLAAKDVLQKTPVKDYDALLLKGTMPDAYRPTLYDFVAHEALTFYSSGERALAAPEDAFVLTASSAVFGTVDEFQAWKIDDPSGSPKVRALRLLQDLLRFHANDADRSAFLAADLERLQFGANHATGEEEDARYVAALKRFSDANRTHALASQAFFLRASVVRRQGDLVEARAIALQGENLHPQSVGGKQCHNLVAEIEAKGYQVMTERVWNAPLPTIDVRYRNLAKLHFRAVSMDFVEWMKQKNRRPEWLDDKDRTEVLARKPTLAWSVDLPATPDYKERAESLPAPKDLAPGFYVLIASHDPAFGVGDNQVLFCDVWVSDLALVTRQRHGETVVEGFVLDARSGAPLAGADVELWSHVRNKIQLDKSGKTDENGLYRFATTNQQSHLVRAKHGGQELVSANDFYSYQYDNKPKPDERTIFFTDRALYRPGQTIQFKGLAIRVDQAANDYSAIKNRTVKVLFNDPNGERIAQQELKTNDFGSFHGNFTAPRDRLMGRMSIQVDGQPAGITQVQVEEYKRPKFQVKIDAPAAAPKLGEAVSVKGTATSYTAAPIDGAGVRWRVVRRVRFPDWWYWYRGWMQTGQNEQEIAHGRATTDADGSFQVNFVAVPDPAVAEKSEPVFTFEVTADVTDTSGETRSAARSVQVAYTALVATMAADEWQTEKTPVEVRIATRSHDGEGRKAEGTVRIHRLVPPETVQRPELLRGFRGRRAFPFAKAADGANPDPDLSNPNDWPLGEVVAEKKFATDDKGAAKLSFELKTGAYQAVLDTQDRFGKPVSARLQIKVLDPDAPKLALKVPFLFAAPKWSLEPGEKFDAVWGSGYDAARAFVEIEQQRKTVRAFWTEAGRTQIRIPVDVAEDMRGGFTIRVTMVRENRAYLVTRQVDVPWSNKRLTVKWERFVSRLMPGAKEHWTAIVTGPDAQPAVAELVAGLYDASLDAYLPHRWLQALGVFRHESSNVNSQFENQAKYLNLLRGQWANRRVPVEISYRSFPMEIVGYYYGYEWLRQNNRNRPGNGAMPPAPPMEGYFQGGYGGRNGERLAGGMANADGAPQAAKRAAEGEDRGGDNSRRELQQDKQSLRKDTGGPAGPDPGSVSARKNLAETAFFFPHLVSSKTGEVRIEFTMPEALTEWKFLGFAHDASLRSGALDGTTVTAKDLMIQPNPPRFVREGDTLEFTVKVTNQSTVPQVGTVRLGFRDARTDASADAALGLSKPDQAFDVPAGESRSFSWKLNVPDGLGFLTYKTVGASAKLSDGEEGFLPVLPRRILVTESLPLPIRGPATKQFQFEHLLQSGGSKTLQHQSVTVQMVSNPSWYAVLSLPYLMEYPYQCSEQVFNRLYANALARHIVQSDPKIARIFEQWRGTPALDSPLTKNQDLKSLLLEETPWLRQANAEGEARRNVGVLFDGNRLDEELRRSLRQLADQQLDDGLWPWFPGGPKNQYISLYVVTGFGRLRHLGAHVDVAIAIKALAALDGWIDERFQHILQHGDKDKNHLDPTIALYLYGRSFFLKDKPIDDKHKAAVEYFRGQAKTFWLQLANRQSQGHLAIALQRFGDKETPIAILNSIRERSVTDAELGTFWRDQELSWWWYRAPIETQALMIEAFEEVAHDARMVDECKVWLLKQKQTQDWKTTKATADAVYALLLRGGASGLASDALVEVTVGNKAIEPKNVEAGTGFYEHKFVGPEVKPDFGRVTVKKTDPGVAWGSVHWQYFEDVAKIPAYDGTPLKLVKTLWTKEHTTKGPTLKPVTGPLEVGAELVVRIEMRVDRDMEYVHLKDQRGSGTEPVDVISKYQYRDGLAYYQSTRDVATHFFIDYLPKGAYVFEYSTWVVHRGAYQSGIATIQCLYAPEFNSHSNSVELTVK